MKRVFVIVLDSFGIGELPDAANYKDSGSNTLAACFATGKLQIPICRKWGCTRLMGSRLDILWNSLLPLMAEWQSVPLVRIPQPVTGN